MKIWFITTHSTCNCRFGDGLTSTEDFSQDVIIPRHAPARSTRCIASDDDSADADADADADNAADLGADADTDADTDAGADASSDPDPDANLSAVPVPDPCAHNASYGEAAAPAGPQRLGSRRPLTRKGEVAVLHRELATAGLPLLGCSKCRHAKAGCKKCRQDREQALQVWC